MSALKCVPKDCDLHIAPLGPQLYGLIFSKSDDTFDFTGAGFAEHQALLGRHGDSMHRAVSMAYTYTTSESMHAVEELSAFELHSFLTNESENDEDLDFINDLFCM